MEEYIDEDHGEYSPVETTRFPSYLFLSNTLDNPDPVLVFSFYGEEGQQFHEFRLDFSPTAINGLSEDPYCVVVGGRDAESNAILMEFRFQISAEDNVTMDQATFGDVSSIYGVSDLFLVRKDGIDLAYVLDGRSGAVGTVLKNRAFSSIVDARLREHLLGKRSFSYVLFGAEADYLGFSEMGAHGLGVIPVEEMVMLKSGHGLDSFQLTSEIP